MDDALFAEIAGLKDPYDLCAQQKSGTDACPETYDDHYRFVHAIVAQKARRRRRTGARFYEFVVATPRVPVIRALPVCVYAGL